MSGAEVFFKIRRSTPLERLVRDTRVHQILEGTNEIMRLIAARRLFEPGVVELLQ